MSRRGSTTYAPYSLFLLGKHNVFLIEAETSDMFIYLFQEIYLASIV